MTDPKWREIVVEALNKATDALNNPLVSNQLRDPQTDVRIADLNIDSLDAVEWCMEIEERTGLELDPAELTDLATVNDVAALLGNKVAK